MAKRKQNVVSIIIIGIAKGIWYVVKGISLAIWWVVKNAYYGIASLFNRADAPIETTAVATAHAQHAQAGSTRHTPVHTPLLHKATHAGDFDAFSTRLSNASMILVIVGKRGSGKSTLGFRLLENIHATTKRPCYVLGVKASVLPQWIDSIEDIDDVHNGGIVLVDEGAVTFSSRDSMNRKNKDLGKLLAIARHKDLTLILVTQNTGMLDKNVLNLADTVMVKEGSLLQQSMERDAMKDIYGKASKAIAKLPKDERVSHIYIVDSDFEGVVQYEMPSFWNTKISKNRA